MPAESKKTEASAGTARRPRLAYHAPLTMFYPTALLFILVNYLAFGTTTDESGTERLLPPYLASYATSRDYMREAAASGTSPTESLVLNALLFFEEYVMGFLFNFGTHIFQSLFGIQVVCIVAWMIHLFEMGMCSRICVACNATLPVAALYMLCTSLGGFAQLVPLTAARNAWLAEVKGGEVAADDAPAAESKKRK